MSRARNIKPGFFKNENLAECQPLTRILFAGLWTEADREGRLEDRPKRLKAELLPYDDCNVETLLEELVTHGFIQRYVVGKDRFIQVLNFKKHQNPHVKEQDSTIPAPCESGASTVQAPEKTGTSTEVAGLIPDSLLLIPDSRGTPLSAAPTNRRVDDVKLVFDHWRIVMGHPQAKLGDDGSKRYRAIAGRLKDGYTAEQLCRAVDGCKKTPFNMGTNDRGEVYDSIDLICRDAAHVDKFLAVGIGERPPPTNGARPSRLSTPTAADHEAAGSGW